MWTEKHIQQLHSQGKIKSFHLEKRTSKREISPKKSREKEWLDWNLQYLANDMALELSREHKFSEGRKWRFDWAFAAIKLAIEYEGLFSKKSRHTTASGFTGDTDKYNQAQAEGWTVLRFTAINYKQAPQAVRAAIKQKR